MISALLWLLLAGPLALMLLGLVPAARANARPMVMAQRARLAGLAIGSAGKVLLALEAWFSGSALLSVYLAVLLGVLLMSDAGDRRAVPATVWRAIGVVLGTLVLTMIMSFVPTPAFPQYFIQPLVCLPLLCALLCRELGATGRATVPPVALAAMIVLVAAAVPRLAPALATLAAPQSTVTARTAQAGDRLRAILTERGLEAEKIATFMPIYPVEAGLPVYPEFATGQFAYRVMPFVTPELGRYFRAVGPQDVAAFLAADPPGSLLLGFEPELEAPFVQFAQSRGYQQVPGVDIEDRYGRGVLFVRPN